MIVQPSAILISTCVCVGVIALALSSSGGVSNRSGTPSSCLRRGGVASGGALESADSLVLLAFGEQIPRLREFAGVRLDCYYPAPDRSG